MPFVKIARAFVVLIGTLGVTPLAAAAPADQDPPTVSQRLPTPDFLFGRPHVSVGLRGSWNFARAGSDLFDFVERQLTVDRRDFDAPGFAVDVGFAVTSQVDALFGVEVSQKSIASEYRALVDNNRQPIEQDTLMRGVNLAGGVRYSLVPRGRSISRFAWTPARLVPYVGAGGGLLWYEFTQAGDFVDALAPPPQPIFFDSFGSKGWTPSAHAFAGVDIRLWRMWFGTVEGRYLRASAKLGRDFEGFDRIDLSGFRLSGGVSVLF